MHTPCVIDIEASGFGRGSYPIEIGFVTSAGESWCSLVLPLPDWLHWDAEAEKLHGISREILLLHGKSVAHVAKEINARLVGQIVYSDGWGNDFSWLNRLYDEAGMAPAFRLQSLRTLLSEGEVGLWHEVKSGVMAELALERHRASTDARVLQVALMRLKGTVSGALRIPQAT